MKPFPEWVIKYYDFRQRAMHALSKPVPSEMSQMQNESQHLEPLYAEAQGHRALAFGFYYLAKAVKCEALRQQGRPASSVESEGKALCHKEIWAQEDAIGICKVIESRSMKIAQHLKLLTGSGER